MAEWGEDIALPATQHDDEFLGVFPENLEAVDLFLRVQRCWRKTVISGMDGTRIFYDGLDYAQTVVLMDAYYPTCDKADMFNRLAVLESEFLGVVNAEK